jgi:hypothetical protein
MRTNVDETAPQNAATMLLFLLLAADAFFVGIHFVHISPAPYLKDALFSIETDGGFSEWFQYIKFGWISLLCLALWRRTGGRFLAGWGFLYGYFLLDDSVQIHEVGGESIARHLHYAGVLGLRPQDLGELTVSAIVGSVFLFTIALTYRKASRNDKWISQDFAFLVGLLVAAGVGVDLLHSIVGGESHNRSLTLAFGLLEDGGEMIAATLTTWYAFRLYAANGVADDERVWRWLARNLLPGAAQPEARVPAT